MHSCLIVLALAGCAAAMPTYTKLIAVGHTQQSSYKLKTDHPVQEPATIIKGVPRPYAVPVPQPYAVPRAVPVYVPRAVPYTVTRTVGVPVVARGEPIVRTRVVQTDSGLDGGLSLGGYGGNLDGGYGGSYGGNYGSLDGGYGGGYGKTILLSNNKGLEYGLSDGLGDLSGHGY